MNSLPGFTHESAKNETKDWYTPSSIFKALGLTFDIDVASPGPDVVPWIPAARHFTRFDNGLAQPWTGKVWCNPPYGDDTPAWIAKFMRHGNGVALVFARTDTRWFHDYAAKADVLCFVRARIPFVNGVKPSAKASCGGAGSLLIACGDECSDAVIRSGLGFCIDNRSVRKETV
jgi:hypothetical protein